MDKKMDEIVYGIKAQIMSLALNNLDAIKEVADCASEHYARAMEKNPPVG